MSATSPPPGRPPVLGAVVDDMTRCVHYRGATDIIAIRFACCGDHYPCHLCHEESAGHAAEQWAADQHDTKAILCGACGHELTIAEYLVWSRPAPSSRSVTRSRPTSRENTNRHMPKWAVIAVASMSTR